MEDSKQLLVSYLTQHGVPTENIELQDRPGARLSEIHQWEHAHPPFKLPTDFKSFLTLNNGFHCKWTTENGVYGIIHVNSLENVRAVAHAARMWDDWPEEEVGTNVEDSYSTREESQLTFFDLDSSCLDGRVALAFRENAAEPQVYFQDKNCLWHFVADSFSKYWQLMVLHMGLPHWQFMYGSSGATGADPVSKQWFRLVPEIM